MKNGVVALIFLLASALPLRAQNGGEHGSSRTPPAAAGQALSVFVDCGDAACDLDYFRTELAFVSYARDRRDAEVHILITTQETADRGTAYAVQFIGNGRFAGANDSLRFVAHQFDSQDRRRSELVSLLKRGLVRYVNQTPLGNRIFVSYAIPGASTPPARVARDRWNLWSLSSTVSGFLDGQESTTGSSFGASVSANRTSDRWKLETTVQTRYSSSRLDAGEAGTFTTIQRNHAFNGLLVRSINGHWSAGARATVTSSTFLNQALTTRLAPAIEYNLFRYKEATRRQLTLQYSLGATAADYIEETIFGKTSETLLDQRLLTSVQLRQTWGSVSTALEASSYMHDPKRRRGVAVTNLDVNIARGLSVVTLGGVEFVRDQLFLPKRGASTDEILLQKRQLATSFRYWMSVGLSYSFGSRFANIVNPRFRGSSAGTNIVQ